MSYLERAIRSFDWDTVDELLASEKYRNYPALLYEVMRWRQIYIFVPKESRHKLPDSLMQVLEMYE